MLNHIAQHKGITYNCQQCFKVFYSCKSFDGHIKAHEDGLLECDQCGKTFELSGSYRNHMKADKNESYICEHQGCEKVHHSYAMHKEHVEYGHTEEPTCQCDYCDLVFWTPTAMCAHRNRHHGPAPHNF